MRLHRGDIMIIVGNGPVPMCNEDKKQTNCEVENDTNHKLNYSSVLNPALHLTLFCIQQWLSCSEFLMMTLQSHKESILNHSLNLIRASFGKS